jgi:hypothetical protein
MVTRLSMIRTVAMIVCIIGPCLFGQVAADEKPRVRVGDPTCGPIACRVGPIVS